MSFSAAIAVVGTTHSPGPDLTSSPKHVCLHNPSLHSCMIISGEGDCSAFSPYSKRRLESVLHVHLRLFVCLGGGQLPPVLLFCRGALGSPCPTRSAANTSQFLLWRTNQRSNRHSPCSTSSDLTHIGFALNTQIADSWMSFWVLGDAQLNPLGMS